MIRKSDCSLAAPPSAQDARQSLNACAAAIGANIYEKYGPRIGWNQLLQILGDRTCVRYPCEIVFDGAELQAGEFAHPYFMTRLEQVPLLVFYQLVLVNYGAFASPEEAETFGAAALGLPRDEYYTMLCALADELGLPPPPGVSVGG